MSIDPEQLMAYADGELDPLSAKRVERAIAADPALAQEVARHRALRAQLDAAFAPIAAEPVPDRFAAMLRSNVVPLPVAPPRSARPRWIEAASIAAALVIGVGLGLNAHGGSIVEHDGRPYAAGAMADALDSQLAATDGSLRIPVSFRDTAGRYCRVFASAALDGIACRDALGWALDRTRGGTATPRADYRQAGSSNGDLMAAAQMMMAGEPLDAAGEARARAAGWR